MDVTASRCYLMDTGRTSRHALFVDGERVECYVDHDWVSGIVHLHEVPEADDVSVTEYWVTTEDGKHEQVHPQSLRKPFRAGESCAFYSIRDGLWLEARVGSVPGLASTHGYSIELLDNEEWLLDVPPSRLRSRFAPGIAVEVYRGPDVGWASAEVPSLRAECDGLPEMTEHSPTCGRRRLSDPRFSFIQGNGTEHDFWVWVPVQEGWSQTEWVESYRLRERSTVRPLPTAMRREMKVKAKMSGKAKVFGNEVATKECNI